MTWDERTKLILDALTAIISFLAAFVLPRGRVGRFFIWIGQTIGPHFVGLMLFYLVVAAGFLAHELRKTNLKAYGIVEIAFGMGYALSAAFTIRPGEAMLSHWTTLVGCTYIIARGLSNVSEARKKMTKAQPATGH
jgi:hypothetical protein